VAVIGCVIPADPNLNKRCNMDLPKPTSNDENFKQYAVKCSRHQVWHDPFIECSICKKERIVNILPIVIWADGSKTQGDTVLEESEK
jgi:hypothetical protein